MVILTALFCYFIVDFIGYRAVALILLLVVSVNAILFDIFPVLLSAILSAFIWNFFFIPPTITLHIGTPEDALLFLMYFVIVSINAILTHKIKEIERYERNEEEKSKTIVLYNTLLNSLSHELKTPIATILGSIDTIKENPNKLSEKNRNELYNEIEIAGLRLNRQVKNLLNMSRIEAGFVQPKTDWCDINDLIFTTIRQFGEEIKPFHIHFEPPDQMPLCKIDGGLVEQIIQNILHNAIIYTPAESTITIEVSHDKTNLFLMISDQGSGFPEQEILAVFDKFYRLKQNTSGGTGLGLSIVKGLTESMSGTVKLENLPEGGSKFTVILPCTFSYHQETDNE
jgi:two-component system sensor histidine kinase KdpD